MRTISVPEYGKATLTEEQIQALELSMRFRGDPINGYAVRGDRYAEGRKLREALGMRKISSGQTVLEHSLECRVMNKLIEKHGKDALGLYLAAGAEVTKVRDSVILEWRRDVLSTKKSLTAADTENIDGLDF